jgi:hypothetical protein
MEKEKNDNKTKKYKRRKKHEEQKIKDNSIKLKHC